MPTWPALRSSDKRRTGPAGEHRRGILPLERLPASPSAILHSSSGPNWEISRTKASPGYRAAQPGRVAPGRRAPRPVAGALDGRFFHT